MAHSSLFIKTILGQQEWKSILQHHFAIEHTTAHANANTNAQADNTLLNQSTDCWWHLDIVHEDNPGRCIPILAERECSCSRPFSEQSCEPV
jgi:hypothetical protein